MTSKKAFFFFQWNSLIKQAFQPLNQKTHFSQNTKIHITIIMSNCLRFSFKRKRFSLLTSCILSWPLLFKKYLQLCMTATKGTMRIGRTCIMAPISLTQEGKYWYPLFVVQSNISANLPNRNDTILRIIKPIGNI